MGVKVRQKVKGKGNPWWVFVSLIGERTSRKVGSKKAAETIASRIEVMRSYRKGRMTDTKNKKRRRVYMILHLTETLKALRTSHKRDTLKKTVLYPNLCLPVPRMNY